MWFLNLGGRKGGEMNRIKDTEKIALKTYLEGMSKKEANESLLLMKALIDAEPYLKKVEKVAAEIINIIKNGSWDDIANMPPVDGVTLMSIVSNLDDETTAIVKIKVREERENILDNVQRKGAKNMLADCPKQLALKEISEHFHASPYPFNKRGYAAKFVREMATKYPIIESYKTIEKLVTKLKQEYPAS